MTRAYLAARAFNTVLGLALAIAFTVQATQPRPLPARYHHPGRVAGLSAYYGLEGAGPGTVGRL